MQPLRLLRCWAQRFWALLRECRRFIFSRLLRFAVAESFDEEMIPDTVPSPPPPPPQPPPPRYALLSRSHKQLMAPMLDAAGWVEGEATGADLLWVLRKPLLPQPLGARCFNSLPQLMQLDDKATLAILSRSFRRTRPLHTHVLYGEWDHSRIAQLRTRWADPQCDEPRWWIVKDAHASNGFSAALFDREARPLEKQDLPGGYCYVVQEYVARPALLDGRKFELRQYVLLRGDGSAYTYERALLRLASVAYELHSADARAHITNKWVQTGWMEANELATLDELERVSVHWAAYERLLAHSITPLLQDLVDAVLPLLARGLRSSPASRSASHFELLACDLVVDADGRAWLMEVNINPAFGSFLPRTERELIGPMFADLLRLCVLPAAGGGPPAQPGGFRQLRPPGLESDVSSLPDDMQEHLTYLTFKKSRRKKYEHKAAAAAERPIWIASSRNENP